MNRVIQKSMLLFQRYTITAIMVLCPLYPVLLSSQTQHTMRPGETIYALARQYNISATDVLRANNISDPTDISIGTNLVIPSDSTNASLAPAATHTVQKGDTYFNIAKKYNLSVSDLLRFNARTADQILELNAVLRLPSSARTARASINTSTAGSASRGAKSAQQNVAAATPIGARVATTDGNSTWPHSGVRKLINGKFPAVVIRASKGDVVRAVTGGRVVHIDSSATFGRVLFVQSASGHIYIYGGNEEIFVKVGERITIGTLVGRVGANQIGVDESQIYFSVWRNNTFIDPNIAPRG